MTGEININKIFDQAMNQPKIKFSDFKERVKSLQNFNDIRNYCKEKGIAYNVTIVPLEEKYTEGSLIDINGVQYVIIAINKEQGLSGVVDKNTDELISMRLDQSLFLVPADQFEF